MNLPRVIKTNLNKIFKHINAAPPGLGILETLLIVVVASVALLAAASLNAQLFTSRGRAADLYTLQSITRSMATLLADDQIWRRYTKTRNPSMNCLNTGCPSFARSQFAVYNSFGILISGVEQPVIVFNAIDPVMFDSRTPTTGYTLNGLPCPGFPRADCPATIRVNWYATSASPNPIIAFTIRLIVHPNFAGMNVGTGNMSFDAGPDQDPLKPPIIYRGTM